VIDNGSEARGPQADMSRRALLQASAALLGAACPLAAGAEEPAPAADLATDEAIERALPSLSNWGRWGPDDQLGTLNLITAAMRSAAAQTVRSGRVVALGREFAPDTAQLRHFSYRMVRYEDPLPEEAGAIDVVTLMCHGFAVTHVDALCHFFTPAGKAGMYNGHAIENVTPLGSRKLGIERIGEVGIVGRGVLLDIAALRGGPLLVGSAIEPQDLELAEKAQNVRVGEGDILFVRNGAGVGNTHERGTGLTASCLPWLKARGVAVLSSDADSDIHPPPPGIKRWVEPIHMVGIPYMGLVLLDNADLDELSAVCASEGRYSFFVSVAPWRLKGATGGAVNPLAMF
jgi:kynurenine formamidase